MPWLIPVGMAVAGAAAGAMSKKSTSQQTVELPDSSPLSQYLYGGNQLTSTIDPELKRRLLAKGLISANTSDEDALTFWDTHKNLMSGTQKNGSLGGVTWKNQDAHDAFEDDFEEYWSGDKSATSQRSKNFGEGQIFGTLKSLDDMRMAWEGDEGALGRHKAIADARGANKTLTEMLTAMRESGGLPSDADIASGEGIADKLFAGRRTRLNQAFEDLSTQYAQRAAGMGRDAMDPILQAKMNQEKSRQSEALSADQSGAAMGYSMALPQQRLTYQQMLTDFQGGLAQQAWNNRAAILGMGQQVGGGERQWDLSRATRTGTSESGGGVGGAITGGMAGFGAGMGAIGGMGGMSGGGSVAGASGGGFAGANLGVNTSLADFTSWQGPSYGAGGLTTNFNNPMMSRTFPTSGSYPSLFGR